MLIAIVLTTHDVPVRCTCFTTLSVSGSCTSAVPTKHHATSRRSHPADHSACDRPSPSTCAFSSSCSSASRSSMRCTSTTTRTCSHRSAMPCSRSCMCALPATMCRPSTIHSARTSMCSSTSTSASSNAYTVFIRYPTGALSAGFRELVPRAKLSFLGILRRSILLRRRVLCRRAYLCKALPPSAQTTSPSIMHTCLGTTSAHHHTDSYSSTAYIRRTTATHANN